MPTRLCLARKCGNPATYRGRCSVHARSRERETHPNKHIYNSSRWRALRRRVILEQPVCAICDLAITCDVDHITPIEAGGDVWSRSNLQGLCLHCHSQKTRKEQATT